MPRHCPATAHDPKAMAVRSETARCPTEGPGGTRAQCSQGHPPKPPPRCQTQAQAGHTPPECRMHDAGQPAAAYPSCDMVPVPPNCTTPVHLVGPLGAHPHLRASTQWPAARSYTQTDTSAAVVCSCNTRVLRHSAVGGLDQRRGPCGAGWVGRRHALHHPTLTWYLHPLHTPPLPSQPRGLPLG
jgi:hypothetical protein